MSVPKTIRELRRLIKQNPLLPEYTSVLVLRERKNRCFLTVNPPGFHAWAERLKLKQTRFPPEQLNEINKMLGQATLAAGTGFKPQKFPMRRDACVAVSVFEKRKK